MSFRTSTAALIGLSALASAAPTGYYPLSRFDLSRRDDAAFLTCLNDAKLETVVQGDESYDADSAPFNLRLPAKPKALVYPSSADDVSAAVKCAAANDVKVTPRSGGHSYAAFGLGGEDGHLVVSLDNLRDITVDGDKACIGAGNRLGDVALGIWQQGERALAHGVCPFVGMGGHAGHGGFGLPSRAWGLLVDQVDEVEVVTADGSIVTANADAEPDLFWAIRGAASSYGIVTKYRTVTHAPPAHNTHFSWTFYNIDAGQGSAIYQAWQSFGADLDGLYGTQITIYPGSSGSPSAVLSGVYYGDDGAEGVNSTWAPLLEQLPVQPSESSMQDFSWIDSVTSLAGVDSPDALSTTGKKDATDTFFADSLYIPAATPMTKEAADAIFEDMWTTGAEAYPANNWFVQFDLVGGANSAITSVPLDATSFEGRDAIVSIQLYSSSGDKKPPYPEAGIPLVEGFARAVTDNMPDVAFKGYVNYVSSELSREESHAFYYPTHTERLGQIKTQYDPDDVFTGPQSFLPA